MQAGGFLEQKNRHPIGMGVVIAIHVAAVGALLVAKGPIYLPEDEGLIVDHIALPDDPPPIREVKPVEKAAERATPLPKPLDRVDAVVDTKPPENGYAGNSASATNDTSLGGGGFPIEIIPLPPVLIGARPDPRFARDFQPPYPAGMQRLGEEGVVVVRVLIGTDGKVKFVERISGDDDAFAAATERHALRRWRFRPATRDGVPVESWRTMTVRFEMTG